MDMAVLNTMFRASVNSPFNTALDRFLHSRVMPRRPENKKSFPQEPLIKWLDEQPKGAKSDLARTLGVLPQHVTNWLSRGIPGNVFPNLVVAIGTNVEDYLVAAGVRPARSQLKGLSVGPDLKNDAPLISWVRAGKYSEAVDNYRVGEAERWLTMPKNAGPHTYCLRVEGDSMTAPYGKSYPNGCIIFVDPEQRSPRNGARIIAKLKGSDEVTFKQLVRDGSKVFLKPLNPQHPPMHDAFKVIGTVIGKWEDE